LRTSEEKDSEVKFTWGLIRDYLPGLRCVFSGAGVELTPEVLPVAAIPAYHKARRRIFMSATLSDEAALVRELDCASEAASNPIELASGGGLGERMIIVPHLMATGAKSLTWEGLAEICKKVSASAAVVVIAPSDAAAKRWEAVGARVVKGDVGAAVDGLRDGRERFVAFSNRYDGIDLPDEACRLLVLDGAPITYSLLDSIDGSRGGPGNLRQRGIMHRIEQGLGRAVRTPSDYAAVVLWGDDLVSLIANRSMYQAMTEETRLQIELGLSIAKDAKAEGDPAKSVTDLIQKCMKRDPGWKKYYIKKVKIAVKPVDSAHRSHRVQYAQLEREAWQLYIANRWMRLRTACSVTSMQRIRQMMFGRGCSNALRGTFEDSTSPSPSYGRRRRMSATARCFVRPWGYSTHGRQRSSCRQRSACSSGTAASSTRSALSLRWATSAANSCSIRRHRASASRKD
jgi:hypothetical protein